MPPSLFEPDRPPVSLRGRTLVRVAVERGIDRGGTLRDWDALTYLAREEDDGLRPGELVTVPLGKSDTPTRGYVVEVGGAEIAGRIDPETLKPLLARAGVRLPGSLVGLGAWMAEYYVCPLGMVMSTMVPAAVKAGTGSRTIEQLERVEPEPELTDFTPSVARAWERIRELEADTFPLAPRDLADRAELRTVREINRLIEAGALRPIEREIVVARSEPALLSDRALAEPPDLTERQRHAAEGIGATLDDFACHLLYGVTGSGKTEVYLRLIERVIEGGRSAIVLVPEISLTPQTSARFAARFQEAGLAVLHSGLTAAQRHREWRRAASGRARVVVGTRSAIFAPVERLGIVIVDEEHDTSYKQDQLPRYNARDVAVMRARLEGCPVLVGSATPSLESWSNATTGRPGWSLWTLPERVGGATLPRVEIVDMATLAAPKPGGRAPRPDKRPSLSPRLRGALRETLDRGEQALILLNRRGYAHYLCCADRTCGWVLECDQCDARLVIHTGSKLPRGSIVRCHHCLSEQMVPHRCPTCAGSLLSLGTGTQRVEEELARVFAADRVGERAALVEGETMVRVDTDTMRSASDYHATLSRFARGEVRVLLGTQMIAKGHDFPNVSLVGVLCADAALALPDFRAAERTFQLVSQVAGRAGRGSAPGLVIVQAYEPEAPAVRLAAAHDYPTFAAAELDARRSAALPPIGRMARVVCRDREFEKAKAAADRLAEALRAVGDDARTEILGPSPCAVERVAGFYRFEVLVLARSARLVQSRLGQLRAEGLLKSDHRTAIDVDPVSLL